MKILNFGSLNVDYVYDVRHIVQPGETIASTNLMLNAGGKGLNQSVAAAKAGANVYHAGAIAQNDESILLTPLINAGVNVDYVDKTHNASGQAIIQRDISGQNAILLFGGANLEITPEYAQKVLSGFDAGDVIILQNEISSMDFIMRLANKMGLIIAFNPSPADEKINTYPLELVDILLLNEIEGRQLTGSDKPDEILDILLRDVPKRKVVLTLGADGAMYAENTMRCFQKSYNVKVVDTTAAGDTFTGYFIANYKNGSNAREALNIATAAAAIAVGRKGAAGSIPYHDEVLEFLKHRK